MLINETDIMTQKKLASVSLNRNKRELKIFDLTILIITIYVLSCANEFNSNLISTTFNAE